MKNTSESTPQIDHQKNPQMRRRAFEMGGIFVLAMALMSLIAIFLPGTAGGFLGWWSDVLRTWFGWGSLWVILTLGYSGIWLLKRAQDPAYEPPWVRIAGFELAALGSMGVFAVLGGQTQEQANYGGNIGAAVANLLYRIFESLGILAGFFVALVLGIAIISGLLVGFGVFNSFVTFLRELPNPQSPPPPARSYRESAISEAPIQPGREQTPTVSADKEAKPTRRARLAPEFKKNFRVQQASDPKSKSAQPRDDRLPPLEVLVVERSYRPDERNINQVAGLIEQTLAEFSIPATVVDFQVGPTVTQFAVVPGYVEKGKPTEEGDLERQKVRVAQISALRRDLALALSAERLRIQAPVPGRPYIGIEVPNSKFTVVRLRPILESEFFYRVNSPLAIGLGRDVSGQPVVADLSLMPHLLVAGATGSGKSVCIAAITTCLVMNNTPGDLRLVIVDPKMVELVRFNGLPHLIGKVETDIDRILAVLRWTVAEMDRRYILLEESRSRNIDTYNKKAHRRKDVEPMPRLVVLIDELADLMMTAPDQTEHNLVRLAQMARATGIHLIVATQRPSTDVVTGLIKANFPARISFSVASSVDSRVILDTVGAEHLLGRGDMLFMPPEASGPLRVQGVMISDQEVENVINFWQNAGLSDGTSEPAPWDQMLEEEAELAAKDVMLTRAIEIVRDTQKASASLLQRRLRIGYPRAARLIDEMETLGVIGPTQRGGKDREVFIGPDDEIPVGLPHE